MLFFCDVFVVGAEAAVRAWRRRPAGLGLAMTEPDRLPDPSPPAWPAATVRRATGDFPRRHGWVKGFTVLNAVGALVQVATGQWWGALASVAFLVACVSAWRATALFQAAHDSGNKMTLNDALEQLEVYFRVATLTVVGTAVLAVVVVAVGVLWALAGAR